MTVRKAILPHVRKNRKKVDSNTYYIEMLTNALATEEETLYTKSKTDHMENILDIR